ncbi:MAG: hypothetical protein PS018_02970 [bacterium]|nr:hypothetical protein [bacterium]
MRFVGQALVVVAITLVLDFTLTATLFSGLKKSWAEAARPGVYMPAAHHHDLVPNREITRVWGNVRYPWKTDRFGFRTGACAAGEPEKGREAIFVIGDSFTEALGSSYEHSFAGLMACAAGKQDKDVYNLGVASYSPAIYHQKIRAAAERLGLKPVEIFVFLDLSDIDDDANVYRAGSDSAVGPAPTVGWTIPWAEVGQFFVNNFAVVHLVHDLSVASSFHQRMSFGRARARWTFDPVLLESWGRHGLEVAGGNLDRIVALCRDWHCRLTLVVYPWPDNVAAGDRDSLQVRHWRDWALMRGIRFVDGFAPFFREPAPVAIGKYFIPGDVHFTEAGNRLLFDEVKKAVGGDW